MRLYVSGPVTGRWGRNLQEFEKAADALQEAGHVAILPHWFVPDGSTWERAMKLALETMLKCDGVALLEDWDESKGARLEQRTALAIGMPCKEVGEWLRRK